jgi:hypothetical protein
MLLEMKEVIQLALSNQEYCFLLEVVLSIS